MTSTSTSTSTSPSTSAGSTRARVGVRRTALAATALLAVGLLASCSEEPAPDATDVVADAQAQDFRDDQAQDQRVRQAFRDLPQPTTGVVLIDGNEGSLTPEEVFRFNQTGSATDVRMSFRGEDQAFQELCAGEVDVVDSSRTISQAELDACRAVGLDVVQFQVASDAVVVAIKNESDVGGDCLSTDQVREVYRAGSPVVRWSQLGDGFDEVPLRVAGPNPENNAFTFFGQTVLDAPQPALVNLRSDYESFDTDQGSRLFVVGRERDEDLAALLRDRARRRDLAKSQLETQWQVVNDAKAEVEVAEAERQKGIRDKRDAETQQADQERQDASYVALAEAQERMRELERRKDEVVAVWQRSFDARKRVLAAQGNLAYFRFSYYELFEEQLRPFEITTPEGERNCIFPSQRTITSGEYPLARRLLLTTTLRSLDRPEVQEFLLHYLDNAEQQATQARLVSLPAADIAEQKDWVTGKAEPEVVVLDPEPQPTEGPEGTPTASPTAQPAR